MKLFIRNESRKNEYRTPLTPQDCKELIEKGFIIYFEKSQNRCFSDKEYINCNCILSNIIPEDFIIIGLKEIENESFFKYKNIYFSHSFKNQLNSYEILNKFKINKGCILDYEYILDNNNKRKIAFGFWAGFAGTALGLLQYIQRINNLDNIKNIKPYNDFNDLLKNFTNIPPVNIAIIGINGRCGQGSKTFLDKLNINYTGFSRNDSINLKGFHIIVNCIYLSSESNFVIINDESINEFNDLKVIVDISCDIKALNNPIKLEYALTDFENPVYRYKNIDIIAIDNLPTLLPKDSSIEFSSKLKELLQDKNIWENLEKLYQEKISYLCCK